VAFPFVEQAARLTRCFDSQKHPATEIQTEYLLCSRPRTTLGAWEMLRADRGYWGIETGHHLCAADIHASRPAIRDVAVLHPDVAQAVPVDRMPGHAFDYQALQHATLRPRERHRAIKIRRPKPARHQRHRRCGKRQSAQGDAARRMSSPGRGQYTGRWRARS